LPPQRECWKRGMDAIEAEAQARFRRSFHKLDPAEQDILVRAIDEGDVQAPDWGKLPPKMFMRKVLLREIVEVYYAHPSAWSEIGFGGPASPRGYLRLAPNRHDPWEGEERPNDLLRAAAAKREFAVKGAISAMPRPARERPAAAHPTCSRKAGGCRCRSTARTKTSTSPSSAPARAARRLPPSSRNQASASSLSTPGRSGARSRTLLPT